jgi:hypothetical protein
MNWKNIFYPSKIALALKIESLTLHAIMRYGVPDIMLQFTDCLGDELLLSIVAQELKKRNIKKKIWQVSAADELLFNNPAYDNVFSMDYWYLRHSNLLNGRRCKIDGYVDTIKSKEHYVPPQEHIVAVLCRKVGIRGEIALVPRVFLTQEEIESGYFAKGAVVVSYPGTDSYAHMKNNKLWDIAKFQEVIGSISSGELDGTKYSMIQIGNPNDPLFQGVLDLRGKTSLRQSASILHNCKFYLGFVGFLMHLARSVDRRSVILYGGFEHSWQSGYICNENINSMIDCAPCWQWNNCERDRACMNAIKVDDVLKATQGLLAREETALEVEIVNI